MLLTDGWLMTRFPAGHKVPEFTVLASLLRMAAKYGFPDVREQLIENIRGAYPTKWEDFEATRVIGEDIFGSPKPHPNAVLNLFSEQNGIRFALPFAAYRVFLGGFPALTSNEPGTVLPRLTLASMAHGTGVIQLMTTGAAYDTVYSWGRGVCPDRLCVLNVDMNPTEKRMEALKKLFLHMIEGSDRNVNVLSPLSFEKIACVNCAKALEEVHRRSRKELIWARLPSLLGWESWKYA